jgi:hypothetical protein
MRRFVLLVAETYGDGKEIENNIIFLLKSPLKTTN